MNIVAATASYEEWLARQLVVLPADLELKHQAMATDAFSFLRATFYRFMQLWKAHGDAARRAPQVLAVGDLHVANFGTWRDVEGRLIWGINDFDEVYPLPYTVDLVRLAVSAHLATDENHLAIGDSDACDSILSGYQSGLSSGGCPYVLEDNHKWLRDTVVSDLRDPTQFWEKLSGIPQFPGNVPKSAERALKKLLPPGAVIERVIHRIAGLGSLGRERYVMLASLNGAAIAREAKALCASACTWAKYKGGTDTPMYNTAIDSPLRAQDPFVHVKRDWIVRRLAPFCSRVDLASLPKHHDESRLLNAMGFELANVHLGTSGSRKKIAADLSKRPKRWLHKSAAAMKKATLRDFKEWRETYEKTPHPQPSAKTNSSPKSSSKK